MARSDPMNPKVKEGATPGQVSFNKFLSGDPQSPVRAIQYQDEDVSTGTVGNPRSQQPKTGKMMEMKHDMPRMGIASHQPSKAAKVAKLHSKK